jgi:hypothetical protein
VHSIANWGAVVATSEVLTNWRRDIGDISLPGMFTPGEMEGPVNVENADDPFPALPADVKLS